MLCMQVQAVDTNGAGDTFATAYMLAVATHAPNPGEEQRLPIFSTPPMPLAAACQQARSLMSHLAA